MENVPEGPPLASLPPLPTLPLAREHMHVPRFAAAAAAAAAEAEEEEEEDEVGEEG